QRVVPGGGTRGKMPPHLILRQCLINGSMRCRSEAQSQPPRDPAPQAAFDRVPPNQSRGDTVTWSSRVGMIALLESSLFKHRLSTDRDRSASQLCRKAEVRVVTPSREHVVAKDN